MPKYMVYIERRVSKWRKVVVEAEDATAIKDHKAHVVKAALELDGWKENETNPTAQRVHRVDIGAQVPEDMMAELRLTPIIEVQKK